MYQKKRTFIITSFVAFGHRVVLYDDKSFTKVLTSVVMAAVEELDGAVKQFLHQWKFRNSADRQSLQ